MSNTQESTQQTLTQEQAEALAKTMDHATDVDVSVNVNVSVASTEDNKQKTRSTMYMYFAEPHHKLQVKKNVASVKTDDNASEADNDSQSSKNVDGSDKKRQRYRSLIKQKDVKRFVAVACTTNGNKLSYGAAIWRRDEKGDSYVKDALRHTAFERLTRFPVTVELNEEQLKMSHSERCDYVRSSVHKLGTSSRSHAKSMSTDQKVSE